MTTLMMVDGDRGESRSEAVARRLRGELAERRISISEAARRVGMTQGALSRRMTSHVAFSVDEVDELCAATGASYVYVTTGIRETPAGPQGPDGGDVSLLPGSNWRPNAYKVVSLPARSHMDSVAA
ncbi:immunity repressor [Gordonia phage Gudmit]|nr:immunity repressor [Gordonia phage Gudmit]